ncbi:hypothetical protein IAT40_005819 [Kwoniella sp. CBS 6097]
MRLTSPTSSSPNSRPGSKHPITTSSRLSRPMHILPSSIATSVPSIFIFPIPLLALLVSYLWAVGRRPDIPEQATIDDPHQWGYPDWYGRHASPYDHGVRFNKEDEEVCDHLKRVMLFIDLQPDSPEIPKALNTLSSLSSSPRFNLTTTISPFSPSWLQEDSAIDNLVRNGCEDVDRIWRIGGDSGRIEQITDGMADVGRYADVDGETEVAEEASGKLSKACGNAVWIQDGESRDMGTADITLLSQPHDMLKPEASHKALKANQEGSWEMGLLAHAMPAVRPTFLLLRFSIFYPTTKVKSPTSVVYFPSISTPPKEYPKLPWGRQWSIYSPSRKGIPRLKKGEDPFSGISSGKKQSKWVKYWLKEEERLAKAMRHAGICLFEGWDNGVVDDRIVKAMLSGCVVATVPPHTGHDIFAPIILPLSRPLSSAPSPATEPDIPAEQLRSLLQKHSTADLKRIALKAFMVARHRLIPTARLDSVERIVTIWEAGGRGYHFEDGFRWDCHSGSGDGAGRAWCGFSQ